MGLIAKNEYFPWFKQKKYLYVSDRKKFNYFFLGILIPLIQINIFSSLKTQI